jgi:CRISPR-associated protein Cas8b/Csh1 subtype I-B
MILNYRNIGRQLIEKEGGQDKNSTEFKRYVLQYFCSDLREYVTIDKKTEEPKIGRLLELNFDTGKKTAHFSAEKQLYPDSQNATAKEMMLFKKPAPNDPNLFGVTNSINYILCFDLWNSMDEKTMKEVAWVRPQKAYGFKAYLELIRDTFFEPTRTGYILNKDRIFYSQAEGFPQPSKDERYTEKLSNSQYNALLKNDFKKYHKETLSSFFDERQGVALTIDGNFLHQGEYGIEYIDFIYHRIIESKYDDKLKGTCHLCSKETSIGKDTSLRQKFYGSTNPLYFDGARKNRTYTSFGICKDCDLELTVGMSHATNELLHQIIGLTCIVLPTTNKRTGMVEPPELKAIERVLNSGRHRRDTITKDIDTLIRLSKKSPDFSMLFYHKEPLKQEFVVIKLIENVNYKHLADKTQDLEEMCKDYSLYKISDYLDLSLTGLRMMILPTKRSHKIKDYKVVAKQIAQLVADYIYGVAMDYKNLILRFIDVWSRIEYDNQPTYQDHDLAAFVLTLYLKHLNNYNQLKGVKTMEKERNLTTQLDPKAHKDYLNYLNNHAYLFYEAENSQYHRGLFLLGVLIGKIERAEWDKNKEKTFCNRLNFRGISPRKVQSLYGTVAEYLKIRDVLKAKAKNQDPSKEQEAEKQTKYNDAWSVEQLLAYCTESLIGIETTDLLPQEVVFYILAGRSYENYLPIYYYRNKEQTNTGA